MKNLIILFPLIVCGACDPYPSVSYYNNTATDITVIDGEYRRTVRPAEAKTMMSGDAGASLEVLQQDRTLFYRKELPRGNEFGKSLFPANSVNYVLQFNVDGRIVAVPNNIKTPLRDIAWQPQGFPMIPYKTVSEQQSRELPRDEAKD